MRTAGQGVGHQFEDPSEPIYTDPSLFERSRQVAGAGPSLYSPTKFKLNCKYVYFDFCF